jgi:hypothetical protein
MQENGYISGSTLLERGWTIGLIGRFLSPADKKPRDQSSPFANQYLLGRVTEAEGSAEFNAELTKIKKRYRRKGFAFAIVQGIQDMLPGVWNYSSLVHGVGTA